MLRELNSQYQGNDAMHFNEIRFLEWILNEGVTPESASRSRKKHPETEKTKKKKSLQNLTLISSSLFFFFNFILFLNFT